MDLSILDTDIDSIDLIQKIFEEYDKHGDAIKFCHENIPLNIFKKCLATLYIKHFNANETEYLQWLEYVNDNICQLHDINVRIQTPTLDNIHTDFLKIAYVNELTQYKYSNTIEKIR